MSEIVLLIDDLRSSSSSSAPSNICRICHDEEFESYKTLEAPCACSGTVKFAHRDCVQRWCDEKGNTTCEICLQKFEPGYTSPPKKIQLIDATVTIRGSLEVPRNDEQQLETEHFECDDAADRSASFCRTLALIFTALLLTRHLFGVVSGAGDYPFSLVTVLIAKASGILVPMYILIRILATLQSNIRHHYQNAHTDSNSDDDDDDEDDDEEDEERRHSSIETLV
ncbi:uncharacterized protein LOC131000355 [Salvia miltiorrhiza]|uniref:uncharacterized protein LOC131000355 n=1 Tax=Salvia miltiorrhiza TaxID=226208 RepID=UPI0025AC710D|nr:uncharacterized protein LOC131000355 [Salvia miltiorrhiza]